MSEQIMTITKTVDNIVSQALSKIAANYTECSVTIEYGTRTVNVKSIMGVLSLGLKVGNKIRLVACGNKETDAIAKIKSLLTDY